MKDQEMHFRHKYQIVIGWSVESVGAYANMFPISPYKEIDVRAVHSRDVHYGKYSGFMAPFTEFS